jgi:hypothetical protein
MNAEGRSGSYPEMEGYPNLSLEMNLLSGSRRRINEKHA